MKKYFLFLISIFIFLTACSNQEISKEMDEREKIFQYFSSRPSAEKIKDLSVALNKTEQIMNLKDDTLTLELSDQDYFKNSYQNIKELVYIFYLNPTINTIVLKSSTDKSIIERKTFKIYLRELFSLPVNEENFKKLTYELKTIDEGELAKIKIIDDIDALIKNIYGTSKGLDQINYKIIKDDMEKNLYVFYLCIRLSNFNEKLEEKSYDNLFVKLKFRKKALLSYSLFSKEMLNQEDLKDLNIYKLAENASFANYYMNLNGAKEYLKSIKK
ncbi:hypothetical protein J2S72_001046 [Peptoniphilus koenoeneniae]|uniref:Lipoprotein n=1 Tax=Peptoniphilus koenoeneniae TaxID=507751 RepID=A0ABU0AUT8_9FIRM|nr:MULTISPECIES: hypothetical protein [Peptoniphilus]ERT57389.1 putative lipoprotein [Peptoniphilus sp. BV3C26]MDQ0275022.1 hypothetical protein [Peptoniphilus koenoeneniae]